MRCALYGCDPNTHRAAISYICTTGAGMYAVDIRCRECVQYVAEDRKLKSLSSLGVAPDELVTYKLKALGFRDTDFERDDPYSISLNEKLNSGRGTWG